MIVWKFVLKVTEVDISEHIISVKLRRPFLQIRKVTPVLEVPIDKIESCKMRKGFMIFSRNNDQYQKEKNLLL
jgi:hypothetical protein